MGDDGFVKAGGRRGARRRVNNGKVEAEAKERRGNVFVGSELTKLAEKNIYGLTASLDTPQVATRLRKGEVAHLVLGAGKLEVECLHAHLPATHIRLTQDEMKRLLRDPRYYCACINKYSDHIAVGPRIERDENGEINIQ